MRSEELYHAGDFFSEEALKKQDGKIVPLRLRPGGPIIGQATMRYDEGKQTLMADMKITDDKTAEFLKDRPPFIF